MINFTHAKLLTMLNVLKVETTTSMMHNCHHMKYKLNMYAINYDYINKKYTICTYKHEIEAHLRNHCYCGKAMSITYNERVCSLSYQSSVACLALRVCGSLAPRRGESSGCGWTNDLRYGG